MSSARLEVLKLLKLVRKEMPDDECLVENDATTQVQKETGEESRRDTQLEDEELANNMNNDVTDSRVINPQEFTNSVADSTFRIQREGSSSEPNTAVARKFPKNKKTHNGRYNPLEMSYRLFFNRETMKRFSPEQIAENMKNHYGSIKQIDLNTYLDFAETTGNEEMRKIHLTNLFTAHQMNTIIKRVLKQSGTNKPSEIETSCERLYFSKKYIRNMDELIMPSGAKFSPIDMISQQVESEAVAESLEKMISIVMKGVLRKLADLDPCMALYSPAQSESTFYVKIPDAFFIAYRDAILDATQYKTLVDDYTFEKQAKCALIHIRDAVQNWIDNTRRTKNTKNTQEMAKELRNALEKEKEHARRID